ncbi:MAG: VCBS repeat-containing protein [Ignavibacteria bacterium]|nr:VCBS repeat-containing protein [Ignavibacteria bacterium]
MINHSVRAQIFEKVDSVFNPFGVPALSFSSPLFCDLDKDGDYDFILGSSFGKIKFFRNNGDRFVPKYSEDTTVFASIYSAGSVGVNYSYPFTCDLDGDGDFDLIIGGYNGLLFFKNGCDSTYPMWQKVDTIFTSVNTQIGTDPKPAFVDIDYDGDFDLFVGIGESLFGGPTPGTTIGFRNVGNKFSPQFVRDNTLVSAIPDVGLNSYPAFADLNSDGDFDLLIGRDLSSFMYYENTGGPTYPIWSRNTSLFASIELKTYWKNPTFCDLDGDGDLDLIYGTSDGTIYFYSNIGTPANPTFQLNQNYFKVIRIDGGGATVSLADYDNDGDIDLVSGDWLGKFQYFRNEGDAVNPKFRKIETNFSSIDIGAYSCPVFIDIDSDGDYDIVAGALDGKVYCFINNGLFFTQNTSIFGFINVGGRSSPAFVDIDNDGDLDLLVGAENPSNVKFYVNDGYNNFTMNNLMITGVTAPSDGRPAFVDIDNDLDFDLIFGGISGSVIMYENTGTKFLPMWERNDSLLNNVKVKQHSAPGFADLNGDFKVDLIVGEYDGNFTFYKNIRTSTIVNYYVRPQMEFEVFQNYPNPFNPQTKIKFSIPRSDNSEFQYQPVNATLKVFNSLGEEITTLISEPLRPGSYEVNFNADDYKLPSGIYYYTLFLSNGYFKSMKMVLLR